VLVSSHLLSEMEILADDVIILAAGRLVTQGPVRTVLGSLGGQERILVRTPDPAALTTALGGGVSVTNGQDGDLWVTGADAVAVGEAAHRAGVVLHQLATERPDLEDVFLELTKGKAEIR
jgi:ABC-2 type transport system ATP-binding protein